MKEMIMIAWTAISSMLSSALWTSVAPLNSMSIPEIDEPDYFVLSLINMPESSEREAEDLELLDELTQIPTSDIAYVIGRKELSATLLEKIIEKGPYSILWHGRLADNSYLSVFSDNSFFRSSNVTLIPSSTPDSGLAPTAISIEFIPNRGTAGFNLAFLGASDQYADQNREATDEFFNTLKNSYDLEKMPFIVMKNQNSYLLDNKLSTSEFERASAETNPEEGEADAAKDLHFSGLGYSLGLWERRPIFPSKPKTVVYRIGVSNFI